MDGDGAELELKDATGFEGSHRRACWVVRGMELAGRAAVAEADCVINPGERNAGR